MGLRKSISRRWVISKDFPLWARPRVLFGSKQFRRELWDRKRRESTKNGGKFGATNWKLKATALETIAEAHVDSGWYATTHGLENAKNAANHFTEQGLALGLAPAAPFADDQGKLRHWGLEYFARMGLPVGQRSSQELLPDDPEAARPFSLENKKRKPLAVVSANFGDYDRLLPVAPAWADTADFFLVSDRKFDNLGPWQLVHANYNHVDPRRRARFIKTHLPTYFSAYERVMWVDGNVLLCRDPVRILRDYDVWDADFATFRHWQRSSLLGEAAACVFLGKDDPHLTGAHLAKVAGHPAFESRDIFATMVMAMNPRSDAVRRMSARWWAYIMQGSKRDQLSLPLAIHDAVGIDWRVFPEESIEMSPNFVRIKH